MSENTTQIKDEEVTKKQIIARLEQLGVEFDPNSNKATLLNLLNEAIESPEDSKSDKSSSDAPKKEEKKKDDAKDGSLSNKKLKQARDAKKDSLQIANEIREQKQAEHDARNAQLLSTKGYNWYLCKARTVLEDGRVCRVGYYYVVSDADVARLGTYTFVNREKLDNKGSYIVEKKPRFIKETPEEGFENLPKEEQEVTDPNEFVG